MMRLGFYHHLTIEPKGNDLYVIGHFGRFLDGLAQNCDELILFMHQADNKENIHDYRLRSSNISWINMEPSKSAPYRTIFGYRYQRIIKKHLKDIDALLIRGPSPLLPALARLEKHVPVALLIGGDYLAGVDSLPQKLWRKELIRLWSRYYNKQQLIAAQKCLTVVNSHRLFEEFKPYIKNLAETKTTTLNEEDFFYREDTCVQKPFHLLYTGRIDRSKGLLDILEAVNFVIQQGIEIVFDLVGKEEKGDAVLSDIRSLGSQMGILNNIHYHGYKSIGDDLFDFYKKADIYIIASQTSEGFPRTIWEAMAHCVPIIATNVGSIPFYICNDTNAVLVNPNRPQEISEAILSLLKSSELRRKLIINSYNLAKANTISKRSKELVESISEWKNKCQSR